MKYGKLMMIFLIVSLMLTTAGCSKTYFFNFTKEEDLIRADGTWSSLDDNFVLSSEGLFMANNWVAVPHVYTGDLTATVRFDLDTGQINTVSFIKVYLSAMNGFSDSEGYAGISFSKVGTDTASYAIFHGNSSQGSISYLDWQTPIPGIDTVGLNTLVIEQRGGLLTFWLNDAFIVAFNPSRYNVDQYCLVVESIQDSEKSCLYYRDVKIEYEGTRELIP